MLSILMDQFSTLEHLKCSKCGRIYPHDIPVNTCECGYPLLSVYDLEKARETMTKKGIAGRINSLWRYHEVLPVIQEKNVVTLGEGMTPIVTAERLGQEMGVRNLMIKDEGLLPTGTFKARGASVGVSKCKELGIKSISMPTNGNAGSAWSTYAARAGISSYIVMPVDAPQIARAECYVTGSRLFLIKGLINDAGAAVKQASKDYDLFDVSTLKEPYRLEGKKTMGYELLEQLDWQLPDVILYPTGGGVGIIGIYKALNEALEMDLIDSITTRLVSVQAEGCAPIVKAFSEKKAESEFWKGSETVAFGINVPKALGDFLVLDSVYKTKGTAIAIPDGEILKYQKRTATLNGQFLCPEGASTIAAAKKLREEGWIDAGEKVLALNTGSGIKYPNTVSVDAPTLESGERIILK